MYRVADGEYRRWLKVTVRSLGLLIDWNWDASVQRKVRGLAVSGPVVLVTANLFTWLFEYSNINCIIYDAVIHLQVITKITTLRNPNCRSTNC